MDDNNANAGGGAAADTGGAGASSDDSSQNSSKDTKSQPKVVPWDVHNRLLGDTAKVKDKNRELEARIGEIESAQLIEKNDYKSLYESEKQKRVAAEEKEKKATGWMINSKRFDAVEAEAEKLGLRKEARQDLDMVDLEDVKVEVTSSGRFLVDGAKEKAEKIKAEKPHWFGTVDPPRVNAGGTGAGDTNLVKKLTPSDVAQAEKDWKRGKISRSQYETTYKQYCKENPANYRDGRPPGGVNQNR